MSHFPWILAAICIVGVILSPALVGFAPLLGDPELMYQPVKAELARALSAGQLPFWSDRFGLGVPLIAESHAAAFYPPNWFFFRVWNVDTAYRLTFWLHSLAGMALTFAYARTLGIGPEGSALAAVSFALCGFQAIHAVHEPFYHAMPYLPLCLLLADRYAATGQSHWLAALALAWGLQITLGHFQIQMWTAGLALAIASWRALMTANGWARKLGRILGLVGALIWGAAIAWIQLRLTWELTGIAGFVRPGHLLANYLFPPAHCAQFALPELFLGTSLFARGAYWSGQASGPGEACAYIGVAPFVLAFVGVVAARRDRALTPWVLLVPITLGLATMPGWWPDGYLTLVELPGFGWFRGPARYTLLTSLALCLLAGRGFDRKVGAHKFWGGLALAVFIGVIALGWSIHWSRRADFQASLGEGTLATRFGLSGIAWIVGTAAIIGWRRNVIPAWGVLGVSSIELAGLLFLGPARWQWTVRLPDASPVMRHLASLPDVGLVAGRLFNLPVNVGLPAAFPNLAITPPPNYLLEAATDPRSRDTLTGRRWQRRLGVSYGVWGSQDDVLDVSVLAQIPDPALDRVMSGADSAKRGGLGPWKIVQTPIPFPSAWVARRAQEVPNWARLYTALSQSDDPDVAWFLPGDLPSPLPTPSARAASVKSWDGKTAIVEHDGPCILVLRRTFYPGWVYRINDGPEQPVLKVDAGIQGVRFAGAGTSRVTVYYRPTGLRETAAITLAALASAVVVLGRAGWKAALARPVPAGIGGSDNRVRFSA